MKPWLLRVVVDRKMNGVFNVTGLAFYSGRLELGLGTYSLTATVAADGTVASPGIVSTTGEGVGTVSVTRL